MATPDQRHEAWLDFLQSAETIVHDWESNGSGRLLATTAAADPAELIARALHDAYERGQHEGARE